MPAMRTHRTRQPAARIIDLLGGAEAVAAVVGKSSAAVRFWRLPASRSGGTDGEIPRQYRAALIAEAERLGVPLDYSDFTWRPHELVANEDTDQRPPGLPPHAALSAVPS